ENSTLRAQFISPGSYFTLTSKSSQRQFVSYGGFEHGFGVVTRTNVTDKTFGKGEALKISHPDGSEDWIILFPDLPFALLRSRLRNGNEAVVKQKIKMLTTQVNLGRPAAELKTLGTGGLLAAEKNPGSYAWLAVAEPQSRNGVVFGWVTQNRGSGV